MFGDASDHANILFYNGNRLSDLWSPYGLRRLGIEHAPIFFTRGILLDVEGLKGRVLDPGEEVTVADLKACLERQGQTEAAITPGDAVVIRTGHGRRFHTEAATFYDGAPGLGLPAAEWLAGFQPVLVGADNFAVDVVPPVDPEVFHPCHQHLIMKHGIYLHEGMKLDELGERQIYSFCYIFAPLPIVGATGSAGQSCRGAVGHQPPRRRYAAEIASRNLLLLGSDSRPAPLTNVGSTNASAGACRKKAKRAYEIKIVSSGNRP